MAAQTDRSSGALRQLARKLRNEVVRHVARDQVALRLRGGLGGDRARSLTLIYVGPEGLERDLEPYFRSPRGAAELEREQLAEGSSLELALARGRIRRELASADVAILPADDEPPGPDAHLHALYLDGVLPVAADLHAQVAAVHSGAHRKRLRKVLDDPRWSVRVGRGAVDLELFYWRFYAPFVRARFGPTALVQDPAALRRALARGGRMLFVADQGREVAAAVLLDGQPGELLYQWNGFALDEGWTSELARRTAALEVALFRHASEHRCARINLGYARALLSDGLWIHKRRLGCDFEVPEHAPRMRLWVRRGRAPELFGAFPILEPCERGFRAVLGLGSSVEALDAWRERLADVGFPGLRALVVYASTARTSEAFASFDAARREVLPGLPVRLERVAQ